ncbi:MAG: hypothetical protein F6K26_51210 [Moorea sp. SIO2I5]|nr:hypothetical protein [Moorena sp. SIO2I5]
MRQNPFLLESDLAPVQKNLITESRQSISMPKESIIITVACSPFPVPLLKR